MFHGGELKLRALGRVNPSGQRFSARWVFARHCGFLGSEGSRRYSSSRLVLQKPYWSIRGIGNIR